MAADARRRCEVVLSTWTHDATFPSLEIDGASRVIDLWAKRFEAYPKPDDVDFVLIFEIAVRGGRHHFPPKWADLRV